MKPQIPKTITNTKGRRTPRHLNGGGGRWGLPFSEPGGLHFGCGLLACYYISGADVRGGYWFALLYIHGMFADMLSGPG